MHGMLQHTNALAVYSPYEAAHHSGALFSLPVNGWRPSCDMTLQAQAVMALEQGKMLFLPHVPFALTAEEQAYLRPDCVAPGVKSIKFSYERQALWGMSAQEANSPVLMGMLQRYAESVRHLLGSLFPKYAPYLKIGNSSFRPVEAEGRVQSKRHDDQRLHVDAFPSRPLRGERILRVFTNIHPAGQPRIWRVGEPFAEVASCFLPQIAKPFPGSAALLRLLKITKGMRTPYDHYMLHIHDRMKLDDAYQRDVRATTIAFPPGASWIVFSDQVSHAAMSGQHALEQTFTLPVAAMNNPATSPLRVLESMKGKTLA